MSWIEGLLAGRSEASGVQSKYKFRITEKD